MLKYEQGYEEQLSEAATTHNTAYRAHWVKKAASPSHHGGGAPGGAWTPSGCCSPTACGRPQAACQRR
eukprot:scaffold1651_cov317-Pinguiococcus_pyrenoidosus.AAC.30